MFFPSFIRRSFFSSYTFYKTCFSFNKNFRLGHAPERRRAAIRYWLIIQLVWLVRAGWARAPEPDPLLALAVLWPDSKDRTGAIRRTQVRSMGLWRALLIWSRRHRRVFGANRPEGRVRKTLVFWTLLEPPLGRAPIDWLVQNFFPPGLNQGPSNHDPAWSSNDIFRLVFSGPLGTPRTWGGPNGGTSYNKLQLQPYQDPETLAL